MNMRWVCFISVIIVSSLPLEELSAEEAPLRFKVEPGTAPGSREVVRLTFENVSDKVVHLYLDRRLAQVELWNGERRLGVCRSPGDVVPRAPDDRRFVPLQPGQRASEELDLRFPCFGKRLALLEKATVVRLTYKNRFGVDRLGRTAWTGKLGLVGMTLPSTSDDEGPSASKAPSAPPPEPPVVTLKHLGRRPDVSVGSSIVTSLEVRGPIKGRLPVAIRPELFSFNVDGPGSHDFLCELPDSRVQPMRDFYDRLGRRQLRFDLASICAPKVFNRPGIFEIRPVFNARFDGSDVDLSAWTGTAEGGPFLVRVRRAGRPGSDPVEITVPTVPTSGGERDAR